MIDGISVALPTWNRLKFLKQCLYSIQKYSVLPKTEASIFVDGSTDGTFEWLEEQGIPYQGRKQHVGAYSGWNNAVRNSKNEYFIVGEDDEFYGPEWDLKLAMWIEELGEDYIVMPQLVEPIHGSYTTYDCGKSVDEFDEEKFFSYCRENARHEIIADSSGFWTMKKSLFLGDFGGFDEAFDPVAMGFIDCQVRLSRAHPNLRWVRVWDSLIYHFPPALHRDYNQIPGLKEKIDRNVKYFRRHGLGISEAYNSIPVGLK